MTTTPKRKPRPPEQRKVSNHRHYVKNRDPILAQQKTSPGYPARQAAHIAGLHGGTRIWRANVWDPGWADECSRLRAKLGRPLGAEDWPRVEEAMYARTGWTPRSRRGPRAVAPGYPGVVLSPGHSEDPASGRDGTESRALSPNVVLSTSDTSLCQSSIPSVTSTQYTSSGDISSSDTSVNVKEEGRLDAVPPEGPSLRSGDGRDGTTGDDTPCPSSCRESYRGYPPHRPSQHLDIEPASTDSGVAATEW